MEKRSEVHALSAASPPVRVGVVNRYFMRSAGEPAHIGADRTRTQRHSKY